MSQEYGARGPVPVTIANDVTLTTSYVDSAVVQAAGEAIVTVYIKYTQGSGESSNNVIYQFKFSPDNTNWYTEVDSPVATGAATVDKVEHTYTADTLPASGSDYLRIRVPVCDQYFKISFKESTPTSNAGTVNIKVQKGTS